MKRIYKKTLFLFRRDLRLADNTALNEALAQSHTVILCFIIDPRQVSKDNSYRSLNALQFMLESLHDLQQQCLHHNTTLSLLHGIAHDVVATIIKYEQIDAIFCNRDYTPFSKQRDTTLALLCKQHNVAFCSYGDTLLNEPESIVKTDGSPYTVFTPFFKRSRGHIPALPVRLHQGSFHKKALNGSLNLSELAQKILPHDNPAIHIHGGSSRAHTILKNLTSFRSYARDHDIPSKPTTNLAAHLKFGTVSIRTAYHAITDQLGSTHPLLRQLYWRDFFTHIAFHNPHVFGSAFRSAYNTILWSTNKHHFEAWCTGTTGFPIVDAGMRQLVKTGFMHNRVRMITASFLIKDLHIDWQKGEQFFAQHLEDYDPAVNNGNWQWVASTGADAQPYFRIFNPWLQQKKFDADCTYIKAWVPELHNVPTKIIHTWFKSEHAPIKNYPKPIIDHAQEAAISKKIYRKQS